MYNCRAFGRVAQLAIGSESLRLEELERHTDISALRKCAI